MADPQTPAWLRPIIITSTVAVVLIVAHPTEFRIAKSAAVTRRAFTASSTRTRGFVRILCRMQSREHAINGSYTEVAFEDF